MTTFFDILKPMYRFWKWFGYISYQIENCSDKCYLKPCYAHLVTTLIIQFTLLVSSICAHWQLKNTVRPPSVLEYFFLTLFKVIGLVHCICNTWLININNNKILNVVNTITNIEVDLRNLNIDLMYRKIKFVLWPLTSIYIIAMAVMVCLNIKDVVLVKESFWHHILAIGLTYTFPSEHITIIKYVTFMTIFKHILHQLNSAIKELSLNAKNTVGNTSDKCVTQAKQLVKIYQTFFNCIDEFGSVISLSLLLHIATIISLLITNMFNISSILSTLQFNDIQDGDALFILTVLVAVSGFCAIVLLSYTFLSESYAKEVSCIVSNSVFKINSTSLIADY